jgi:nucleotide-binding universal stress UspA family protein
VALDASPLSLHALRLAARLAASLGAAFEALFVEDENLLRLARLPFARAASRLLATSEPCDDLALQLRALAAETRRAVEVAAREAGVAAGFRAVRGSVAREVVAAAAEADLLVLGYRAQATSLRRPRLGATARVALAQARSAVALVQGTPARAVVAVACDRSPASENALEMAAALAEALGGEVLVLCVAGPDECAETEARAERLVGGRAPYRLRHLSGSGLGAVQRALRAEPGALLVLPESLRDAAEEELFWGEEDPPAVLVIR